MGFTSDRHSEGRIHIDKGFGSIFSSTPHSVSGSTFGLGDGLRDRSLVLLAVPLDAIASFVGSIVLLVGGLRDSSLVVPLVVLLGDGMPDGMRDGLLEVSLDAGCPAACCHGAGPGARNVWLGAV